MKTEAENHEANGRLTDLMIEAGNILRDYPDLKVRRIAVNEYGIHTMHKMPASDSDVIACGPDVLRDAFNMVDAFPKVEEIEGAGFAAIYDGLTVCIESLGGIIAQPRCVVSGSLTAAGEYLEQIEQFLMFERRRIMDAAAEVPNTDKSDGNYARLCALLRFKADEADLTFDEAAKLLESIKNAEAGKC